MSAEDIELPYLADPDVTIYQGDALEVVRGLSDESVHCVVTSPPYWGLRDYGTGEWEGGDPDCDHKRPGPAPTSTASIPQPGYKVGFRHGEGDTDHANEPYREVCGKCGARRIDQQLGLEPTPDQYVHNMVELFREVKRVLRRDGTCWLNLGDTYSSDPKKGGSGTPTGRNNRGEGYARGKRIERGGGRWGGGNAHALTVKPKDLVGIPWRVAFALQADGWWLRSDIIWSKPNPMPESVTDRPTKAHEYLFLLTRSAKYSYDADAIREPAEWARWGAQTNGKHEGQQTGAGWIGSASKEELQRRSVKTKKPDGWDTGPGGHGSIHREGRETSAENFAEAKGRNARSVWLIATQPYPEAHFATFPEELARRCIVAGTSEYGCCPICGAPWERETDVSYEKSPVHGAGSVVGRHYETGANNFDGAGMPRLNKRVETTGWRPSCDHDQPPIPCVVLDPFVGSGTVAHVARKLGRRSIGIELNPDYCALAARRLQQQSLFA